MANQFTDTYKKLSTSKLLDIIENHKDYQPIAVETAKLELASRQDIEEAKAEVQEKNIKTQKKLAEEKQKRKNISDNALKVLEYVDPLVEKTPEKTIVIICVVLLLVFLYKTVASFGMIVSSFRGFAEGDITLYWFLLEYLYLPVTIFFLWRKTKTGWKMLLFWLIYQCILDCSSLYIYYKMSGIDDSFMRLMPIPDFSGTLLSLALHSGLIYFICKPNIKSFFQSKTDGEPETEEL